MVNNLRYDCPLCFIRFAFSIYAFCLVLFIFMLRFFFNSQLYANIIKVKKMRYKKSITLYSVKMIYHCTYYVFVNVSDAFCCVLLNSKLMELVVHPLHHPIQFINFNQFNIVWLYLPTVERIIKLTSNIYFRIAQKTRTKCSSVVIGSSVKYKPIYIFNNEIHKNMDRCKIKQLACRIK